MAPITQEQVLQALEAVLFESAGKSVVALGLVKDPVVEGGRVRLTLEMPSPGHPNAGELAEAVRERVEALDGVESVSVETAWRVRSGDFRRPPIPGVKTVIAVASGKGGVGKSTVAANLACGLARLGAATGLLDLDIYGPSLTTVMGTDAEPRVKDGQQLVPTEVHGLRILSMGQLARDGRPVVWRGPMLHQMVMQFTGADWGELDYLVLDLPPGTGDVQLTVTQSVPLSGAVIVTTPQEIALIDARKGLTMFRDQHVPILGLVENMAYYRCRKCGKSHPIFGADGGRELAAAEDVPLLARLPIDPRLVESSDAGRPLVLDDGSETAEALQRFAAETAAVVGAKSLRRNPFKVLS